MRKLPLTRLCWLALRASTALVLTVAPYHVTFDGAAKIKPAAAHAESAGSVHDGGGGDDGKDGGDDHGGSTGTDDNDDDSSGSTGKDTNEDANDDSSTAPVVTPSP
jgi:hypothetical protein